MIDRDKFKEFFKGAYKIQEIIDYIDEITDVYHYQYENLIIDVYYRKTKDKLDKKKIQRVLLRCHKIANQKRFLISSYFYHPQRRLLKHERS